MALLANIIQRDNAETVIVSEEELNLLISENKYDQGDSLSLLLQKYSNLCKV